MKTIIRLTALLFALLVLNVASTQTIYKSIGPNGVPVYSDRPPADGKIEKTYEFAELPSSPVPPQPPERTRQTRGVGRAAPPRWHADGVVLFATSWCGYCKRARAYMAQRNIAYQEIDIETPDGRNAFTQAGGRGGVPLLVSGSRRVQGFNPTGYDAFFAIR